MGLCIERPSISMNTCTHSVDCLAQCSAPAGLGKYLDSRLQTKCAHWPPSPQARVAEQLVRGGAETGKLARLWLRLRLRRCGSERRLTTLVIPRSPATKDTEPLCHVWGRLSVHGRLPWPFLERRSPGHRTIWQTRRSSQYGRPLCQAQNTFSKRADVCCSLWDPTARLAPQGQRGEPGMARRGGRDKQGCEGNGGRNRILRS